jgi:hypothetical protein
MKILELSTFENVKAMLESPDKENMHVGFQCLKEAGLCKENLAYILWMIHEVDLPRDTWIMELEDISESLQKMLAVSITHKTFSPNEIIRIMQVYDEHLPENNYAVFADRYAKHVERLLGSKGEKFKVQIKITKL